ncbi:MAG: hypothetical protein J6W04_04320 [Bacteroidales bacterium]|nr:hypothetical protein [Bacteroidales bacterium]
MARAKKSSLDTEEPLIVQGEETKMDEPIIEAEEAPVIEKTVEKTVSTEKTKAETQEKTVEKKAKRGVKICVM